MTSKLECGVRSLLHDMSPVCQGCRVAFATTGDRRVSNEGCSRPNPMSYYDHMKVGGFQCGDRITPNYTYSRQWKFKPSQLSSDLAKYCALCGFQQKTMIHMTSCTSRVGLPRHRWSYTGLEEDAEAEIFDLRSSANKPPFQARFAHRPTMWILTGQNGPRELLFFFLFGAQRGKRGLTPKDVASKPPIIVRIIPTFHRISIIRSPPVGSSDPKPRIRNENPFQGSMIDDRLSYKSKRKTKLRPPLERLNCMT